MTLAVALSAPRVATAFFVPSCLRSVCPALMHLIRTACDLPNSCLRVFAHDYSNAATWCCMSLLCLLFMILRSFPTRPAALSPLFFSRVLRLSFPYTPRPMQFQHRPMHTSPSLRMSTYDPEARLKELGIDLPSVAAAAANYVSARTHKNAQRLYFTEERAAARSAARVDGACLRVTWYTHTKWMPTGPLYCKW